MGANYRLRPSFLDSTAGRVFTILFEPDTSVTGAVLCVAPFGEEMNRTRSLMALQARAFAERGIACLMPDLFGTGDSDGDLPEASWSIWLDDLDAAAGCLERTTGCRPTLWGIRSGALLAAELVDRFPDRFDRLLFWQPVVSGKSFVTQTLRQRVAALVDRGAPAESTAQMRAALADGNLVEVSGYLLPGALTGAMDQRQLVDYQNLSDVKVEWLECVAEEGDALPGGSRKVIEALEARGACIASQCVVAPPVWSLHQKADGSPLVTATTDLFGTGQ